MRLRNIQTTQRPEIRSQHLFSQVGSSLASLCRGVCGRPRPIRPTQAFTTPGDLVLEESTLLPLHLRSGNVFLFVFLLLPSDLVFTHHPFSIQIPPLLGSQLLDEIFLSRSCMSSQGCFRNGPQTAWLKAMEICSVSVGGRKS